MKKSKWVVDHLSKDDLLYLEVKPTLRSTTGLKTYIGARGTESKLEKGHHSIAHFANGGMRHTLADFLGMGGLALYNLRIRYRLKLAKMDASSRAKVPVGFQKSPPFTNHLRLSHINKLGREAGLCTNVHADVEVLQPDNQERFFYEAYLQQKQRDDDGVQHDDKNRCLCRDCGRDNPYRKRKPQWESQDDIAAATTKPTPVPAPPQPLEIQPRLPALPLALLLPPQQLPPQQLLFQQVMPQPPPQTTTTTKPQSNAVMLPYSAIVAADKKKKKRVYRKKKCD